MPDILKMKELVETLEKTVSILDKMSDKLSRSMDRMVASLDDTRNEIKSMSKSVDNLAGRTGDSMENISKKFDTLVETLLVVSKGFKNPLDIADQAKRLGLDPKSVLSTARDILKR